MPELSPCQAKTYRKTKLAATSGKIARKGDSVGMPICAKLG